VFGDPPKELPDGLTADEYFELGNWYEETSDLSNARKALQRVIDLSPRSDLASRATRILALRIPLHDVPQEAIKRLQEAEGNMNIRADQSRRAANKLIAEYPQFEWPHRIMAETELRVGKLDDARKAAQKALDINPQHATGLLTMARVCIADMDYAGASKYVRKASDLIGETEEVRVLQRGIEYLIALDEQPVTA